MSHAPSADDTPLSAQLEAQLVRELAREYAWENHARFRDRLIAPVIALDDAAGRLGLWTPATRTLSLARRLVLDRPWPEVIGVLQHEMAHQFVDEVLRVRDETAHGETFARVCAERGIDARAGGEPIAAPGVEVDRALDRIRKLFALAGSANQHEAELAMRTAHELMLRYNLDAAHARTERRFEVRHLGDPSRRGAGVEARIMALLGELFFVEVIRIPVYLPRTGKHGHVHEVIGTHANVEMAVHVHAFLLATAERLWRAAVATDPRIRSGRDRPAYLTGVIEGFRAKLVLERSALAGTGLVWRGDGDLAAYYRARHPRIVTRRTSASDTGANRAGREAGHKVVLHRPIERGGTSGGGRLLGGG